MVMVYRDYDLRVVQTPDYPTRSRVRRMLQVDRVRETLQHATRFWVFGEILKVRDFRLVLCADVRDCVGEYSVLVLEETVAAGTANGGLTTSSPNRWRFTPRGSSR